MLVLFPASRTLLLGKIVAFIFPRMNHEEKCRFEPSDAAKVMHILYMHYTVLPISCVDLIRVHLREGKNE